MKILLIEDDRDLTAALKGYLGKTFLVDAVRTGAEGQRHAISGGVDVIVLDLSLPDKHGYDVCRALRHGGVTVPILILSGARDLTSRITLLNAGADDYLTKPFSVAELRSRIHALLRRPAMVASERPLVVGDLVVDTGRRQATRSGREIILRRKEYEILEYLARNPGKAVTRSMIISHAWDNRKDSSNNTVDVHIKHLRDKLDRPFGKPLIKTAYGIGYMLDDM
jgi:DNA-binding response OmpR family regulator